MKTKIGLIAAIFFMAITHLNAQGKKTEAESLGLPGDNLDLYATLDLFQKSKTIEEFEASLNDEKKEINNLDLDLDNNVDFIKVVTKKEDDDFTFVLQVDVLDDEVQDVAVILVTKDKDEKVTIQMVGDEELYGKDYVIEPKPSAPAITANPAYSGTVAVTSQPATVVVLESAPVVQYVYSPVYVPYHPPYYYGYYPVYYTPYPVISINIYFGRNRHHHNHYHGGHRGGNTVIINNNNNTYNNYSKTRNTSNTVNKHKKSGNYARSNTANRSSDVDRSTNNISNREATSKTNHSANNSFKRGTIPAQVRPPVPPNMPNMKTQPQRKNMPNMKAQPQRKNMPKRNPKGN